MKRNMPKVEFKIDIEKDAMNYFGCANSEFHFGRDFTKCLRQEMKERLKGKRWHEIKAGLLKTLNLRYSKDIGDFKKKIWAVEKKWKNIERRFFDKLEKITKKPIYAEKFTAYMTTLGRCPYNDKESWFMIAIFWDIEKILTTICHELMHLQFIHYYKKKIMRRLKESDFQGIKEALTVLLNLEFNDILKSEDKGYPGHQELRRFIEKEWNKDKNFDRLVEKCIDYVKQSEF